MFEFAHSPNFKNLLKINDPYISVLNIFETIKNKTDLKSDQEIAHFLQTIDITKKSTPFNKAKYFEGKPVELFRDYQNKTLTEMDLLLIELSSGEICINSNDLRLTNFVFDKFDFLFEFRDITNFDLDSEDVDQADSFEQTQQNNEIPLFYLNDTFSLIEAACVLSGDNSIQMNRCFNDTNFDQNYPEFNEAYSFICSAVQAGRFAGDLILANDLKSYLRSKGKIIDGFNDQLKNEVTEQNLDNQNSIIDQLKKENTQLKARIAELESQQNNITGPTELNGIHAINQHKSDLQSMARVIASKKWADDDTVLIGTMADAVYRQVAQYTTDMPETTDTVKNWIRPVAPASAQKRGRPPNKN